MHVGVLAQSLNNEFRYRPHFPKMVGALRIAAVSVIVCFSFFRYHGSTSTENRHISKTYMPARFRYIWLHRHIVKARNCTFRLHLWKFDVLRPLLCRWDIFDKFRSLKDKIPSTFLIIDSPRVSNESCFVPSCRSQAARLGTTPSTVTVTILYSYSFP